MEFVIERSTEIWMVISQNQDWVHFLSASVQWFLCRKKLFSFRFLHFPPCASANVTFWQLSWFQVRLEPAPPSRSADSSGGGRKWGGMSGEQQLKLMLPESQASLLRHERSTNACSASELWSVGRRAAELEDSSRQRGTDPIKGKERTAAVLLETF